MFRIIWTLAVQTSSTLKTFKCQVFSVGVAFKKNAFFFIPRWVIVRACRTDIKYPVCCLIVGRIVISWNVLISESSRWVFCFFIVFYWYGPLSCTPPARLVDIVLRIFFFFFVFFYDRCRFIYPTERNGSPPYGSGGGWGEVNMLYTRPGLLVCTVTRWNYTTRLVFGGVTIII